MENRYKNYVALSLSYDHRIIDGEAARFNNELKENLGKTLHIVSYLIKDYVKNNH